MADTSGGGSDGAQGASSQRSAQPATAGARSTACDSSKESDLVISIGSLGNHKVLAQCLRTVFEEDCAGFSYEVWVVFNGHDERPMVEMVERDFPAVRLFVTRGGPLGYCRTHNVTLERARGRYILVLDDDTLVPKGTLSGMVRFMDEHPEVGMAGCETLNADGSYQRSFGLVPSLRTEVATALGPEGFWPDRLYRDVSQVRDVEWLNGSFMLARRRAIDEVGVLDEHYYTYVCEPDWAFRMRRAGWRVVYVPDFHIVHWGGEHSINNKLTVTNHVNLVRYHVNRFYFFRKHYGVAAQIAQRFLVLLGCMFRTVLYVLHIVTKPDRRPSCVTKLRAFAWVFRLAFSARPDRLPAELEALVPGDKSCSQRVEEFVTR